MWRTTALSWRRWFVDMAKLNESVTVTSPERNPFVNGKSGVGESGKLPSIDLSEVVSWGATKKQGDEEDNFLQRASSYLTFTFWGSCHADGNSGMGKLIVVVEVRWGNGSELPCCPLWSLFCHHSPLICNPPTPTHHNCNAEEGPS